MNRVSIKQLADALNVSKTTVSRSLNNQSSVSEATRKRVLELAREWGYVPRRVGASTRCIAIGFGKDSELLTRPGFPSAFSFDSAVIAGVLRGCTEQRYHPKLLSIDRDRSRHETLVQYMKRRGVEGVIMRSHAERPEIAERLADENFPCVLIASESQHPNMSYMRSDSFPDSLRAVEMLFELGHRDIALVIHTVLDRDHVERERAFREAFERRGLKVRDDLVVRRPAGLETGCIALDQLLHLESPPTAVFCTNPTTTAGLLSRCLELGLRVPRDLSVIGVDDSQTRTLTFPQFTAVIQDAERLGYEAALWLTRFIEGVTDTHMRVVHRTSLDVRDSIGPVPEQRNRGERLENDGS